MFRSGPGKVRRILNKRRIFWLLSSVLSFVLFGLLLVIIGFYRDYRNISSDHLIGNRASGVRALKETGFPFSFLVIGDSQNSETAETLIQMALQRGKSSFLVMLGDFVKRPDIWQHRFFLTEMVVETRPPFSVFLVPGNHDIDYFSSKRVAAARRVTPEIYDSLYGARSFHFDFNNCLFVICEVDLKKKGQYLEHLRETLSANASGKKHAFVFIHYPPKGLTAHIPGPLPSPEAFFALMETYKVTTCFFGDYHGYWRGQRKGVHFIVTGGGGRHKKSQSEWGKFHHIMRVTVDQDKVSEEVMTIEKQSSIEDTFEEMVFARAFPIIENKQFILYAVLLVPLFWGISSVIITIRDFWNKHPMSGGTPACDEVSCVCQGFSGQTEGRPEP